MRTWSAPEKRSSTGSPNSCADAARPCGPGGIPTPPSWRAPSSTGTAWRDDDRQPSQEQRRNGWQSGVSAVELGQSMEILGAFGLDRLYGPGPDPLVAADQVRPALDHRVRRRSGPEVTHRATCDFAATTG